MATLLLELEHPKQLEAQWMEMKHMFHSQATSTASYIKYSYSQIKKFAMEDG